MNFLRGALFYFAGSGGDAARATKLLISDAQCELVSGNARYAAAYAGRTAVAQCVFHRFCLNIWKDLNGSTREERDRLVVVRNWLHRLQQLGLPPEFDHEVNALKKHKHSKGVCRVASATNGDIGFSGRPT